MLSVCLGCGNGKKVLALMDRTKTLNSEHGCFGAPRERACLHDRLRLEFYIDWGEQQSMKIRVTRSCSLCFSTNIRTLKKKKLQLMRTERHLFHKSWNWLWGISLTVAEVSQSAEGPICGELPQGLHHPPSTAASLSSQSWLLTPDYEEMFGAGGTKKTLLL